MKILKKELNPYFSEAILLATPSVNKIEGAQMKSLGGNAGAVKRDWLRTNWLSAC